MKAPQGAKRHRTKIVVYIVQIIFTPTVMTWNSVMILTFTVTSAESVNARHTVGFTYIHGCIAYNVDG